MRIFLDSTTYYNFLTSKDGPNLVDKFIKLLREKEELKLVFPRITEFEVSKSKLTSKKDEDTELKSKEEEKDESLIDGFTKEEKNIITKKKKEYWEAYRTANQNKNRKEKDQKEAMFNKIFGLLKQLAITFEETPEIVESAQRRYLLGYPPSTNKPGKVADRLADCLAWELLLENCTEDDLVIVSFDSDWADFTVGSEKIHPLLEEEWTKKSGKSIELIKTMSDLLTKFRIKVSKKAREEEERGTVKTQGFPYTFPVTFTSSVSPSVSTYPGTITTVQPGTYTSWEVDPATTTSSSISWSVVPTTTTTSSSSSGATISQIGTIGSLGCKNCGHYLSFIDNFCPKCGTKRD